MKSAISYTSIISSFLRSVDKPNFYVLLKSFESSPGNQTFIVLTRNIHNFSSVVSSSLAVKPGLENITIRYLVTSPRLLKVEIQLLHEVSSITVEICSELSPYQRVTCHPALVEYLIVNSVREARTYGKVYVLSKLDQHIIKYLEYNEFYWTADLGLSHIEYILPPQADRSVFFEVIHRYTRITSPHTHPDSSIQPGRSTNSRISLKSIFYSLPIIFQNLIRRIFHKQPF